MTDSAAMLALVGFGEAGQAFATGWGARANVRAHDLRADRPRMRTAAAQSGIACHGDPAPALADAAAVLCLVTADQALAAATACGPHLMQGALWLDGNSCAPGTKRAAARVIEAAGGRYVDLAIMAPVHPRLHRTPGLLSGPHAETALSLGRALDMDWRITGENVGDATAIKMQRSVMIKGFDALSILIHPSPSPRN